MPDQVIIRQADALVGDVRVEVVPAGDGVWTLGVGEHRIPFKGTYDEAIAATDGFAAQFAPVATAKEAVLTEVAKVDAYVEQVKADFEAAKPVEVVGTLDVIPGG